MPANNSWRWADTPFYVQHGFSCPVGTALAGLGGCQLGTGTFSLYVDGVLQPSTKIVDNQNGSVGEGWLTNFPNGLPAGDHTLVGVWTVNGVVGQIKTATITFT